MRLSRRLGLSLFLIVFLILFLFLSLYLASRGRPKSGDALFADDFSKSDSGWNRQADADVTTGYVDGEYQIAILAPNLNVWAASGRQLADVAVAADARTAAGPDNNLFGLICRYQDNKNFYFLVISSDSYFVVGKLKEGRINYLSGSSFEYSDKILPGQAAHHLTATCIGNVLTLAVDGAHLADASDDDFKAGLVGLMAGSFDEPGVDVRFDNLVVFEP